MFNVNECNKEKLNSIFEELIKKFPDMDKDVIKNRVYNGFVFGEGHKPITTLDDWIDILSNKKTTSIKHIDKEFYINFINPNLVIIYNFKSGEEFAFEYEF